MKAQRLLFCVLVAAGLGAILAEATTPASAPAENPPTTQTAPAEHPNDCRRCHACEHPSVDEKCLPQCTRQQAEAEKLAREQGPQGVILLNMHRGGGQAVDRFGPVPFDHSGHSQWSKIQGGCTICHHYTPEGASHPACPSCHSADLEHERTSQDIEKPSLKGAYHRQCLGCHREWSHNNKCDVCHLPLVGKGSGGKGSPTEKAVLGHMRPPIPEPDTEICRTQLYPAPDSKVIFRHKEHIHRFGIKCAECHMGDNCKRCHEEGRKHEQREVPLEQHHKPCSQCHGKDTIEGGNCRHCHWHPGQPEPPRFDHAQTGWPLNRFHQRIACRDCHRSLHFSKLNPDCNSCHTGWEPGAFDHSVTGVVLDENHTEIDCADCHEGRKFDQPPACGECHDEDVRYPASVPGRLLKQPGAPAKKTGTPTTAPALAPAGTPGTAGPGADSSSQR